MAELRKGNIIWKNNLLPNSPENPVHIQDVNSDSAKERLDLLATEAKLEQVRALLSGVATEGKLEQARILLNAINTKDFATQTTLAATLTKLGQLETELATIKANQTSGDQKVQLPGSENFAKDLTIQEVTSELELVKAELQTIKNNQLSGDQKVQLSGTIVVNAVTDLPAQGYVSQVALVKKGQRVFIHDGNGWGEW